MGRRYLIAAGTSHYPDIEKGDLPAVPDDIQRIVDCLTHKKLGYTRVLPELAQDPTSNQLRAALGNWFTDEARSPADQVVFYYAGHGESHLNRHYLLTADSNLRQLSSKAFPAEDLARFLCDSLIQQALIILDTCYAEHGITQLSALATELGSLRLWNAQFPYGFIFVAAARKKQGATEGAFAKAFTDAVKNSTGQFGGKTQEYLDPPTLVEHINQFLKKQYPQQTALWHPAPSLPGNFPPLLPNRFYDPALPQDLDLASQRQRDLVEHWVPRARGAEVYSEVWYFTGREVALRKLVRWLHAPTSEGKARVVTGGAGTGKSALLAWIVMLSHPEYRQKIARSGVLKNLPRDTIPCEGIIDIDIHARRKTLDEIVKTIATAAEAEAASPAELAQVLATRQDRFVIVLDALDEAQEARSIARELLRRLTGLPHVWLLVGSRPDIRPDEPGNRVQAIGGATVEINLDDPRYLGESDLANYVYQRLLAATEPARATPYRHQPKLARTVAEAVAKKAGMVFLVARIVAHDLIEADAPVDVTQPDWQKQFPSEVGEAFATYLERFNELKDAGLDQPTAVALLRPLAYAEGEGLPWDNIWRPLANAIAGRSDAHPQAYSDVNIESLLKHAGAYIVEGREHGRSVYRLYHQALVDYLHDKPRTLEIQRRITHALINLTPDTAQAQGKDWLKSDSYVLTHLASHAAASDQLGSLVSDPMYLVAAEPTRLLHAITSRRETIPPGVVRLYQGGFHHLGRRLQLGEGGHSNENPVRFWNLSPEVPKEADARCYALWTAYATMIRLCNISSACWKMPAPSRH
jgi:hypothetical protein